MNDITGTVGTKADALDFLINGLRVMTEYETMSFEQLQSAVINFCDLAYEQVEALKDIIAEKKAVKAA